MGFFNLYKARKYDYRYIYYDPKKEAQKEREKRIAEEGEKAEGEFKTRIRRGSFREEASKNKSSRKNQSMKSNFRLVLILGILLALAYYLLK